MINWSDHIVSNPKVLFGKPVIKNTRVPVDLILEKLAHGETFESIKSDYPKLTDEMLYACLAFASKLTNLSQTFEISG